MNAKTYWAIIDCHGERFEFCLADYGQVDAMHEHLNNLIDTHEPFSVSYETRYKQEENL